MSFFSRFFYFLWTSYTDRLSCHKFWNRHRSNYIDIYKLYCTKSPYVRKIDNPTISPQNWQILVFWWLSRSNWRVHILGFHGWKKSACVELSIAICQFLALSLEDSITCQSILYFDICRSHSWLLVYARRTTDVYMWHV